MTKKQTKYKTGISSKTRLAAGSLICASLSAAAAALYFFAYHTGIYEKNIHHYASGSRVPAAMAILLILSAVVSIVTAVYVKKAEYEEDGVLPEPSVSFGIFLVAFMFIGYFIASVYSWTPLPKDPGFGDICDRLCPVLGLLSSVPFICDTSGRMRRTLLHRLTSVIPVVWSALLMFKYYFDLKELPLNDPELILTDISAAAVILFFLTESRRALVISTPLKNTAASFLTAFITLPIALVRIILFKTDGFALPEIMENILLAAIGILAVIRIVNDACSFAPQAYTED